MATLKLILIIFEVLLLFNLLIGVHELGHFLAAKWRGLKIDRFAIWFGPTIWKKKIGGVEFVLNSIPAGGYVALPQMATMEMIEGKREAKVTTNYGTSVWTKTEAVEGKPDETPAEQLPPISALDKIIVAFAGPLFSFLLAVVFACIVWKVGKPEPGVKDSTEVGWVVPVDEDGKPGPAWKAGLRPGDHILEIDHHPVKQFAPTSPDSIIWRIITSEDPTISIKYLHDGQEVTTNVAPTKLKTKWYERKSLRKLLIGPASPTIIAEVVSNGPADLAGLKPDDEIIKLNGTNILAPDAVAYEQSTMTNSIKPVTLTIRRGDQQFDRTIVAEKPVQPADADPVFGMSLWFGTTNETLRYPTPGEQIRDSAGQIFATIGAVVSRKTDIGIQQLGSAVMIVRAYKNFLDSENGWRRVLWFSVVLNVNLALINLIPFPVLDGGHILLALLEVLRRRPVSAKILQMIQTAGAIVLISFMLFLMFFDVGDWIRSARREQPVVFAPKH